MLITVEATIKNGELELSEPLRMPEGTKAIIVFLGKEDAPEASPQKWLETYLQKTKGIHLGEEFVRGVQEAREMINRWNLTG